MDDYAIDTQELTRRFGKRETVKQINLKVPKREIYGFLGPNGAGKTTTIRMLLGLIRSSSGDIRILGKDLNKHRMDILKDVGSLVESPSYYAHLSGYKNLKIMALIHGIQESRIQEVLEWVRLSQAAHRPVKSYSLGMKQRLGIAMALITNPKLLILDEPTNGLDPSGIQEIRELITRLPRDFDITVLLSSHLLSEIEQVATWVGIINQGELIFQGPLQELTDRSKPYVWVEMDRPLEAAAALNGQGFDAVPEITTGQIRTSMIDRPQSAEMIRFLVNHQYDVYRVTEKKKTLEEIFLELTGQENSL
ncbi:bacitracin ABC transporter ATP-binding protein [Paenibacillus sp. LC231]|uniref:ABC transporter ATP-binding protein n=1 Tax=Paenibacillus sp. LC231 TaxID=1120679 RepID=UPI0008DDD082|nr:ABC transporter ATP-binding protein [Paenibacillus sp. LC231]OIB01558.1 bacitracin ABC transporter ATP-binding protein [Paenibacillus sp. LC231]